MKSRVFYDGDCYLCSWEIRKYYKENLKKDKIEFISISDDEFDPKLYQIENYDFNRYMCSTDEQGQVLTKMDSFRLIWRSLGYNNLLFTSNLPIISGLMDACYEVFAALRPYLPKNKSCSIY